MFSDWETLFLWKSKKKSMFGKIESVQIPFHFVLCYKSNYCQAGRCLCYQVIDYVSEKWHIVNIVNPSSSILMESVNYSRLVI